MSANVKIQASDVIALIGHYAQATANMTADILRGNNIQPEHLIANIRRINEMADALLAFIVAEQARNAKPQSSADAEPQTSTAPTLEDRQVDAAQ